MVKSERDAAGSERQQACSASAPQQAAAHELRPRSLDRSDSSSSSVARYWRRMRDARRRRKLLVLAAKAAAIAMAGGAACALFAMQRIAEYLSPLSILRCCNIPRRPRYFHPPRALALEVSSSSRSCLGPSVVTSWAGGIARPQYHLATRPFLGVSIGFGY
uniref:Uncharacterized protein n=1 Tax=Odontella aurita TaxID=265563 RepID=A0A7S4JAH9_9STRA